VRILSLVQSGANIAFNERILKFIFFIKIKQMRNKNIKNKKY